MSYLVLARKWRPQTFEEVVGQEHVTRTLRNAIQSGRMAHAFLFTGPRGVGKTTIARLLAKAFNCENGPTPDPCNNCSNCNEITIGSSLDVLEIDGASHTGVDNVRDITEGVQYRPAKSRFRVVIIDEVHMLSNAAFNALLKTLEEPPEHVKFIFATTEVHKILQTILSRCQRYDFKRIPLRELIKQLTLLAEHEGFTFDEVGMALVAREADGSLRDAESLLEQVVTWSDGNVNEQTVRDALGVADRQALFRVADAVLDNEAAQVLRVAGDLYQYGYDPRRLCCDLLEHFHQLVIAKVSPDPALLADLPDHEIIAVQQQAGKRSLEDLQRFFTLLLRAEEEISHTAYSQLVIEMTLVKLASQPPVMPIDEALAQLTALQQQLASGGQVAAIPAPSQSRQPQARQALTPGPSASPAQPAARASQPSVQSVPSRPATPAPTVQPEQPVQVEKVQLTPSLVPSEPQAPLPEPSVKPTLQSVPSASADEEPWDRFLSVVQKTKLSLFFALKSGELYDLTETVLLIGVNKDPYFKELNRKENTLILEEAAQRVFGRKVSIEITKGPPRTVIPPGGSGGSSGGTGGGTSGSGGSGETRTGNTHTPDTVSDSRVSGSSLGAVSDSPVRTQPQPDQANGTRNGHAPAKAAPSGEDPLVKTVLDVLGGEVQSARIRVGIERPQ
jgi:DNA polymerase-3 subunit gamma/tau